jgi:hypothetical protein
MRFPNLLGRTGTLDGDDEDGVRSGIDVIKLLFFVTDKIKL